MSRSVVFVSVVVVLVLCVPSAAASAQDVGVEAQEEEEESGFRWGLGISTTPFTLFSSNALHVPLDFGEHVRVEPGLGFSVTSMSGSGGPLVNSQTNSDVFGGLGVFYRFRAEADLRPYVGGRLQASFQENALTTTSEDGQSTRSALLKTTLSAAPVFGLEYVIAGGFTIGVEVGAQVSYGFYTLTPELEAPFDFSEHRDITVNVLSRLYLRYFF